MYQQNQYDMMARQRAPQQMMQAQNNNITMAQIHLSKLRQTYPETILYRQTQQDSQHRVPLKLSISPAPLYIKVTLSN